MSERFSSNSPFLLNEATLHNLEAMHQIYDDKEISEAFGFNGGSILLSHDSSKPSRYTFLHDSPADDMFLVGYDVDMNASPDNILRIYKSLKPGWGTDDFIKDFLKVQDATGMSVPASSEEIKTFENIFFSCCDFLVEQERRQKND
jgi:hypothetical protein